MSSEYNTNLRCVSSLIFRKAFLHREDAILLQVQYANAAGFEENQRLDGQVTGNYYSSKTTKTSKKVESVPVNVASFIYDSGVLTVSVYKPNKNRTTVERVNTLILTQVEFVTLLQLGYYWKKPESKNDPTLVEKVVLIP